MLLSKTLRSRARSMTATGAARATTRHARHAYLIPCAAQAVITSPRPATPATPFSTHAAAASVIPSANQSSHSPSSASTLASASSSSIPPSRSVDPSEIAKFSRMASQWWDPHGQVAPLHRMNPVRVRYIREQVTKHRRDRGENVNELEGQPLKGLDVLDVGCGGGLLAESLARLGGRVHGVDAASASIRIAELHAPQDPCLTPSSLRYSCTTAESLLASSQRYDVVCALEVVEHVTHPPSFIQTIATLVKPGGMLFMSTINKTTKSWFMTIVGAEHLLRWVPVGTHDWEKFIPPSSLKRMIGSAHHPAHARDTSDGGKLHFHVQDVCGMVYDPLRCSWSLSSDDTDVNYIMTAVREDKAPQQ